MKSLRSTPYGGRRGFEGGFQALPSLREEETSLASLLASWPKVDLHRHLEGSWRLSTLLEVAREQRLPLPEYSLDALRPYVQMVWEPPDFHTFLGKFRFLRRFYHNYQVIRRVAYEAVADAAADNVRYLELRFSPLHLALTQGFPLEEVADQVWRGVKDAERDFGVRVGLIATIARDYDLDIAWRIARLAVERKERGFVGLDLAGDEVNHPAWPFREIFQMAREVGLGITVHAGEVTGADSVWEAVEVLGAQRIGHGIGARNDPELVKALRERGVTLEVCLTSNLHTGAVRDIAEHPLRAFHSAGVQVTLNTDDPSISDTTLTREYVGAVEKAGLGLEELREIIINGIRAAFLPPWEKERLEAWFRKVLTFPRVPGSREGS